MLFGTWRAWLNQSFGSLRDGKKPKSRLARHSFRPGVEMLEDRRLPAVSLLGPSGGHFVDSGTDTSASIASYTVGAGSNRLLVVSTGYDGNDTNPTVTFNGVAMTRIVHQGGVLNARQDIRVLTLGTSAAATTGSVSVSYGNTEIAYVVATTFAGVDQSTPVTGSGNASTSINVSSAAGDMVLDGILDNNVQAGPLNAGGGQVSQFASLMFFNSEFGGVSIASGASSVTMSWTPTDNSNVLHAAVDIHAAPVLAAPAITGQPSNTTVNAGGTGTFTAAASGNPVPTEQWQVSTDGGATFNNVTNGGVYGGATAATLTITGATAAMNGYEYKDVFTNSQGSATTNAATLTVDFAPTVTTNPTNQTINAGSNTSFTAAATGNPAPTVQWQVSTDGGATFNNVTNGGVYSGATTGTLTITGATLAQNTDEYQAVFSNTLFGAGSPSTATTTAATLTVDAAPVVSSSPSNTTINAGGNTSFLSSATGNPAPTEQWQVSTDGGATFNNVTNSAVYSGATTATFSITAAGAAMNGYEYKDIFTNGLGNAPTTAATLTVDFAPAVTTNPTNQTINAGSNTSFTAAATGNPAPTVQWQVSTDGGATFNNVTNGGVYSGAGTGTLTITAASAAMNGDEYQAVFSNTLFGAGSPITATTTKASLTVDFAPTVITNPSNVTVNEGSNTSFTSAFTDGLPTPTSVQWQVSTDGGATFTNVTDGGVYTGTNTTTLSITGVIASLNGYMYQTVFSNAANLPATTSAATLTVDFAPTVTTNPTNQTTSAGNNISFTAAATGNPAPTVQWQVSTDGGATFSNVTNGGVYSGATTGTLNITNDTTALNGFKYHAVFSNTLVGAGSPSTVTSTSATLTIVAITLSALPDWTTGQPYTPVVTASGGTGPYTFSLLSGTPPTGLTLNPNGTFTGSPTATGPFTFTIKAAQSALIWGTQAYSVTINKAPTINALTVSAWTKGAGGFAGTMQINDGTPPHTIVTSTNVPTGLTPTIVFSAGVYKVAFTGTPTAAGVFSGTVKIQDNAGVQATQNFSITINPPIAFTLAAALPTYTPGTTYPAKDLKQITGGTGLVTFHYAMSGPLPNGMSLVNGVLSGTPTSAATTTITVTATDSVGAVTVQVFTLTGTLGPRRRGL